MGILDNIQSPEQVREEKEKRAVALQAFFRGRIALLHESFFSTIADAVREEYKKGRIFERAGKKIVRSDVWFSPIDHMDCVFPSYDKADYAFLRESLALLADQAPNPTLQTENCTVSWDNRPVNYTCTYHLARFSSPIFTVKPFASRVAYDFSLTEIGGLVLGRLREALDRDPAFVYRFCIGIEDGVSDDFRRREETLYPIDAHYEKVIGMRRAIQKFDYLGRPYVKPYLVAKVAYICG